jgi:hypothetical protein
VLPAARATEAMAEELLAWAAKMPLFATHLTGACTSKLEIFFWCTCVQQPI